MSIRTPDILLRRWKRKHTITTCLLLLLMAIGGMTLYHYDWISLWALIGVIILGGAALYYLSTKHTHTIQDVPYLAHQQNDQLEYSGELLLTDHPTDTLAFLQRKKAEKLFASADYKLPLHTGQIRNSILLIAAFLIGAVSLQSLLGYQQGHHDEAVPSAPQEESLLAQVVDGVDTAYIDELLIKEVPASYTGLATRYHSQPDITITQGAQVSWIAKTKGPIDKLYFRFSEKDEVDVTQGATLTEQFFESDFYQYGYYNEDVDFISDFYSIKVQPDEKPSVIISGIEEYTKLPYEEDHVITFDVDLRDDYQLSEAYITATIAKGSGESVKFREKRFDLKDFQQGRSTYEGTYTFSTAALQMEAGDELYFHIKTNDNYPFEDHTTKSSTYFIALQDTSSYDYIDEGGLAVDLIPDFFRSQRQIIIDSERLLKNKDKISLDSFKQASNALGFDQKLLRLKYGQFLGEESESGIAIENDIELGEEEHDHDHDHDHDHTHEEGGTSARLESARELLSQYMHDHDHGEEEGLLMATKGTEKITDRDPARPTWVEELSHNHDNAEVNTFLEISSKIKLREALSKMWDAELHLRLFDPATSLPYQYQSLELLQEIKNHARIYVHRIGYEPAAIKVGELRLQGDLDEISNPDSYSEVATDQVYAQVKELISTLGSYDRPSIYDQLDSAIPTIARLVLARPDLLPALSEANRIKRDFETTSERELDDLRSMLLKLLPDEAKSISSPSQYAHEITLSVAKKINF